MNNKNNIENQIKSQLENRELKTSNEAWDKLSQMMDSNERDDRKGEILKNQTKKRWFPYYIAASVAIVLGIVFGWNYLNSDFNSKENKTTAIVKKEIKSEKVENNFEKDIPIQSSETKISQTQTDEKIEKPQSITEKKGFKNSEILVLESNTNKSQNEKVQILPKEQVKNDEQNLEMKSVPAIALNADSVSNPRKKADYVDPEMLLYSIENNKAVQEKNSSTRLVIIDFNK